ncbi:16S rRNA (cytidine(1402)-2'-O)-methyltransferase [Candidatus Methylacidiphilum infernorum]|uniref:Ribosomal RNA small subunit methyltransferase I n=1 Tax=Candidatus Methylacidiphilum infernorum TaxID=511746 RepID=A0ABX7PTE6_9BACT|nr:16S rRNA (cytidine(1402)-2'-O)-methyltransferase [Candidatus Methylacidiphilum infernorum]QSR86192.1 16S rRNA (cytidine(1402)-2'-O)-methyltransferase [Candidatus Methylacidiphilum infernorum]
MSVRIVVRFLLYYKTEGSIKTASPMIEASKNINKTVGRLFVVGTPIGNLEDITYKAIKILKDVDLVAAEDTRKTLILFQKWEIKRPLFTYNKINEEKKASKLIEYLLKGKNIALVSEAGMPCISDPGERLIKKCIEKQIPFEVVPGPSAVLQALVLSGFRTTPFYFGGFLPIKSKARKSEWREAAIRPYSSVYFESPHRLLSSLDDACGTIPDCLLCLAKEMTKKFEEVLRGKPKELLAQLQEIKIKGEFCIVVDGYGYTKEKAQKLSTDTLNEIT